MEEKGLKLTLDLDKKEFDSKLRNTLTQVKSFNSDINKLKENLKLNPKDLESYLVAIDNLNKKMESARRKAEQWQEVLNYGLETDKIKVGDDKWVMITNTITKLQNEFNKAQKEVEDLGNSFNGTTNDIDKLNGSFEDSGVSALKLGDIIKANLISDAIKWGFREVIDLAKELGRAYIDVMKNGIEYNANMETFTVSLRAMGEANGDTVEQVDKLIASMKDLGAKSAFSTNGLLEVSQQLMGSGISAEEAGKNINDLAKILAYAGKSDDELKRMAQNLNQIKNAGKATAVDLKQFAYAGVPVYKLLADYSEEFATISKDTKVTYEDLVGAFSVASDEGSQYFYAIDRQAETFNGQLEILKENWNILSGVIAQDVTGALRDYLLPAANETLDAMIKGYGENGFGGLLSALVDGVHNLTNNLSEAFPQLQPFFSMINDVVDGISNFFNEHTEDFNNIGESVKDFATSEEFSQLWSYVGDIVDDVVDILSGIATFEQNHKILVGVLEAIAIPLKVIHATLEGIKYLIDQINMEKSDMNFSLTSTTTGLPANFGSSGGWGNSGGFGNLQAGGFGNNITINASFTATSLDEANIEHFADILTDRINENLGGQI